MSKKKTAKMREFQEKLLEAAKRRDAIASQRGNKPKSNSSPKRGHASSPTPNKGSKNNGASQVVSTTCKDNHSESSQVNKKLSEFILSADGLKYHMVNGNRRRTDNYAAPLTDDHKTEMHKDLFDKTMDDASRPSENASIGLDGEVRPQAYTYRKPSAEEVSTSAQEMIDDVNEVVYKFPRINRIFGSRRHAVDEAVMRKLSGKLNNPILTAKEYRCFVDDPMNKEAEETNRAELSEIMKLCQAKDEAEKGK